MRNTITAQRRGSEDPDDPRLPAPFAVGVGLLVAVAVAGVCNLVGVNATAAYLATLAGVAVVAWWCRPAAALLVAAVAFLAFDGFVLDGMGDLSWDGVPDAARLALLLLVALTIAAERAANVTWRRRHTRTGEASAGTRGRAGLPQSTRA